VHDTVVNPDLEKYRKYYELLVNEKHNVLREYEQYKKNYEDQLNNQKKQKDAVPKEGFGSKN